MRIFGVSSVRTCTESARPVLSAPVRFLTVRCSADVIIKGIRYQRLVLEGRSGTRFNSRLIIAMNQLHLLVLACQGDSSFIIIPFDSFIGRPERPGSKPCLSIRTGHTRENRQKSFNSSYKRLTFFKATVCPVESRVCTMSTAGRCQTP